MKKPQKTLKELGVTSKDLNTALGEVSETIFNAKEGTEQIVIAQKAFGKAGADLIPVIKQFGGNLAEAQKEAERLGITLTEKDIQASDDFGDALGLLGSQAKTAAVAFTSDLMPVLTRFFTLSSEWYGRNQEEVRLWGFAIARTLEYTVDLFSRAFTTISKHAEELRIYLASVTFGLSELAIARLRSPAKVSSDSTTPRNSTAKPAAVAHLVFLRMHLRARAAKPNLASPKPKNRLKRT
jgi:hypothetical protein